MWGLPQITNPSPQLLIQAPDSGAKALDSLCQAPDCLSKVQIPNPGSRISEQFFQNFGAISQHRGACSQQSGAPRGRSPPFALSGAKCGVCAQWGQNPPLTPFQNARRAAATAFGQLCWQGGLHSRSVLLLLLPELPRLWRTIDTGLTKGPSAQRGLALRAPPNTFGDFCRNR